MRHLALAAAVTAAALLSGCAGGDDRVSGSATDLGSSLRGSLGRNSDTYGTQRRMDVYGGATAPSLPTIGMPGYGK